MIGAMARDEKRGPAGGATMQLDAIADDLEEFDAPDLAHQMSAPPPLPPKKAGKGVWIAGALVVILATGLGLGVGLYVLNRSPEPAATDQAVAEPATQAEQGAEATGEAGADGENVVSLEEVVFDDTAAEAGEGGDQEDELPAE